MDYNCVVNYQYYSLAEEAIKNGTGSKTLSATTAVVVECDATKRASASGGFGHGQSCGNTCAQYPCP